VTTATPERSGYC